MSIETPSKEMKQEMKKINEAIRSTLDYKIVELEWTSGTLYVDGIDYSYEVDLIKEQYSLWLDSMWSKILV